MENDNGQEKMCEKPLTQNSKSQDTNFKLLMESHALRLRRKKNKKIWSYFEPVSKNIVRCKICKTLLSCKHTSANLVRHMFARHQVDSTMQGAEKTNYIQKKQIKKCPKKLNDSDGCDPLADLKKTEETVEDYKRSVLDFEILDEYERHLPDDEVTRHSSFHDIQIDELDGTTTDDTFFTKDEKIISSPLHANSESLEQNSPSKLQAAKLRAETRYYNEMASLAQAKRIMIQLQTEKMRRELGIFNE